MLKLLTYPDPFLTTSLPSFDFDTLDAPELERQMIEIMVNNNGVGLAANQVGINGRIIVVNDNSQLSAMIDPVIIGSSNERVVSKEGCLSFPYLYFDVFRSGEITVEFKDINNTSHTQTFGDFTSTIIQHEIDHLNGIVFTEHTNKTSLYFARKQQTKLRKRNGRTKR